ncbi:MAG: type II toxin-antitoxin system HicA family toxin [Solirubrobacteraceae bacterium]
MAKKFRDVRKALRRAGWTLVRTKGDHEQWRSPDGRMVVRAQPRRPDGRYDRRARQQGRAGRYAEVDPAQHRS